MTSLNVDHLASPTALSLPYSFTNTVTQCKLVEKYTKQLLLALPQHYTAPTVPALI
jgi:hypothetical protein